MDSLADQLHKTGLVSDEDYYKQAHSESILEELEEINRKLPKEKTRLIDLLYNLDECKSIKEFRYTVKLILERDWQYMDIIISKAHILFKKTEGNKKLFWSLFQVRDNILLLENKGQDEIETIIRQAFRKANQKIDTYGRKHKKRR